MHASDEPNRIITRRETMERSHALYAVTLRSLLLSAPFLIALSAPLAAPIQVQKTGEQLAQAAKAVEAVSQGPGAAIGGIHGDVRGASVGLATDRQGGYVLAEAGEKDKKQQQLTQQEREKDRQEWWEDKDDKDNKDNKFFPLARPERMREHEREKERTERRKDKDDDEDDDKRRSPHKNKHKHDEDDDKRFSHDKHKLLYRTLLQGIVK